MSMSGDLCFVPTALSPNVAGCGLQGPRVDVHRRAVVYRATTAAQAFFEGAVPRPASESSAPTTIVVVRSPTSGSVVSEPGHADEDWMSPEDETLFERLQTLELSTRQWNWDSDRGEPVRAHQWRLARDILRRARGMFPYATPPHVSACGDGTVHLSWLAPGPGRGVLEIGYQRCWWTVMSASSKEDVVEEIELKDAPSRVAELLRGGADPVTHCR